ncbi:MAG: EAL domain-containing protein [Acetivibrio sp.]
MGKQEKDSKEVELRQELLLEEKKCKSLKLELEFYKRYDTVSGLYNRTTFYAETKKMLHDNRQMQFVMLRMDIERFKIINELWGREEGDKLLRYIGDKLRYKLSMNPLITFGRTEADIFYICFVYSEDNDMKMIDYIEKILSEYEIDFEIVPYFGMYVIKNHDMPINLMCDRTNLAIRTIKGNYIKRYAYYDENLRKAMLWEQEIVNQMATALLEKQFVIYLQPQCNIQTGVPVAAEVLVRWNYPKRGMIFPGDFIPIFERNGLIMKLDAYVWEESCKLIRRWLDEGKHPHPISVNVSRINLYNPKLCDTIIGMVEKYDLPVKLLELEITESAYSDSQNLLISVMERLQKYGFTVLMDDFGSGYSSLNMLKEAVVDILKLDLIFLSGEDKMARGGNILASVVRMAKWLKLACIAEGVETKEQVDFLRSIGCTIAQGYYYAKPMPIDEYEIYLERMEESGPYTYDNLEEPMSMDAVWDPTAPVNAMFNSMISAVGIYEYSKGHIEAIRLNDSYFDMIGETREEYYQSEVPLESRIYEEDQEIIQNMYLQALETKEITEGLFRRICKNGKLLWLHTKIRYFTGDKHRVLFYAAINDVTREKEREFALEKENQELKQLVILLKKELGKRMS